MKERILKLITLLLFIFIPLLLPFIFPEFMNWLLGGVFTGNLLAIICLFLGPGIYIAFIIHFISKLK